VRFNPKSRLKALLALLGLLAGLTAAGLFFPHQVLCVDSGATNADAAVVLGGGSCERPQRAAELFHQHAAPRIFLTGYGDCETNQKLLTAAGVPAEAIELECKSSSTRDNARFTIPLLRARGARRVIIVTSWYHSRRALNCFRHYAPDIQFFSRPSYYAYPRQQWVRSGIRGYLRVEYVKLLGYWICYGVCPF